jgi:D-3-phosphoglycerate dehydrogenase
LRALAEDIEWHRDIPSNEDELLERVKNADAIISSRATVPLTDRVISSCPKLKIIARAGTGVDHIDLVAATKNGITVTNSPGCATPYVAEHALALALATCRQSVENDRHIRQGLCTRAIINAIYGKN